MKTNATPLAIVAALCLASLPAFCASQAVSPTPLERSLRQWSQGKKDAAIKEFLQIDWAKATPFSPKSPLTTREKDLLTMSASAREKVVAEVHLSLKDLKQLANAVKEKAASSGSPDIAKQTRQKLDQCAKALNQPESLKILQLTAQAIKKMASAP